MIDEQQLAKTYFTDATRQFREALENNDPHVDGYFDYLKRAYIFYQDSIPDSKHNDEMIEQVMNISEKMMAFYNLMDCVHEKFNNQ
jgi:hypothetical protein